METKRCGAKAKQKKGTTCGRYPTVGGNGRCKLHNGNAKKTHGRWTYRAKKERTLERNFLAQMVEFNDELLEKLKRSQGK